MLDDSFSIDFLTKSGQQALVCQFSQPDLANILEIEKSASAHPWTEKNFADSIASSHLCVGVKINSFWVAHAVFSIAADEAELLIIAVSPKYQGQGIAKQLICRMEEALKHKAQQLFLEVRVSNRPAIELYESLGFNRLGERRNYYPSENGREDAIVYGKCISL